MQSFTVSSQTRGTRHSSIVERAHGQVAGISWNLDLVILTNVLLDDSGTARFEGRLLKSSSIEISFRKETVVAGNVFGNFRSSN